MKLGEIIRYLDTSAKVILQQTDVYTSREDNSEKVFEGSIMDIPWIYLDFTLVNDDYYQAIDIIELDGGRSAFYILIKEGED